MATIADADVNRLVAELDRAVGKFHDSRGLLIQPSPASPELRQRRRARVIDLLLGETYGAELTVTGVQASYVSVAGKTAEAPSLRPTHWFPLPPLKMPGYPCVDDPAHPLYKEANAGWPHLSAAEADLGLDVIDEMWISDRIVDLHALRGNPGWYETREKNWVRRTGQRAPEK
jgi:hypothetical protein